MVKNKLFVKIIFGIILAILITSFLNVGISLFYEKPEFTDFCDEDIFAPRPVNGEFEEPTQEELDEQEACREEYEEARDNHSRIVFFILAPTGLIMLIIGIFLSQITLQIMLMGAGFFNLIISIFRNIDDKISVFITIGVIIIIGIFFVFKKLKD